MVCSSFQSLLTTRLLENIHLLLSFDDCTNAVMHSELSSPGNYRNF